MYLSYMKLRCQCVFIIHEAEVPVCIYQHEAEVPVCVYHT